MNGLGTKRIFGNQSGVSLVELLIAVGLIGGVAVSLMQARDVLSTNQSVLNQRLEEDNIYRSIQMIFNDKLSCENTLARAGLNLNPAGVTGQEFTEIRDEADNIVYTKGMIIGRGSGSPVEIEEMRISHFQTQTAAPPTAGPVYWNNTDQATVSIKLERVSDLNIAGSGVSTARSQSSITRRFQVIVERDGSGAITGCKTDRSFYVDTICEQLSGTLDDDNRCRSISVALAGDTLPTPIPSTEDNIAIRVGNNARVDGVTAIVEKVELGDPATFFNSPSATSSQRGIHAKVASFIDGYLLAGLTQIPALGPLPAISLMETGNIHIPMSVTVGSGGTAPVGGLYVEGEVIAPRIKLFGMEDLVNLSTGNAEHSAIASNPDWAASVGYVARRITNTLTEFTGSDLGSYENVLADILSNASVQPQGALALFRYVCEHTQVTGFASPTPITVSGVFTMEGGTPFCRINFRHRMRNCSINPYSAAMPNNPNDVTPTPTCVRIMARNIEVNDRLITNWNELIFPP
jgi:hypothetical protein